MSVSNWTEADSAKASETWSNYQNEHDLSNRQGQTAGIDPVSGQIWFGESIEDVIAKRNADGSDAPLKFERVGAVAYYRKGGHR